MIRDIKYGENFNVATQEMQELNMDAYLPPLYDDRTERPVIVYIHGGGFHSGDKTSELGVSFLRYMVKKGFVGVSIEYRLTAEGYDGGIDFVLDAVEDARAAVRFLYKHQYGAKLDTSRIALMGYSAGAFTAATYAYVDFAQDEGESGNPGYPDDIKLVISLAGAIRDASGWFDFTDTINSADEPALIVAHGTEDPTVPYVGGRAMFDRAREVGVPSAMITIEGARHNLSDYLKSYPYNIRL